MGLVVSFGSKPDSKGPFESCFEDPFGGKIGSDCRLEPEQGFAVGEASGLLSKSYLVSTVTHPDSSVKKKVEDKRELYCPSSRPRDMGTLQA